MILQALYRYYGILLKDPELGVAPPGYSAANVSFSLNLSSQGELLDILPFTSKLFDGKKERERSYRRLVVPEQVKRSSGVSPNYLCDNAAYVIGVSKNDAEKPQYCQERFEAFRQHNIELLAKANSNVAHAVIAFMNAHDPQTARRHPVISRQLESLLQGGNLVFWVEGQSALEDPEIRRVWEEYRSGEDAVTMQCLVTGDREPIARLHPSIQGVRDANPTGASLVGFNERAYESYNRIKGQGLNSPTSQRVASGYGVALNYLLSSQNPNRKIHLGDMTVVYWAESEDKRYPSAFAALITPEYLEVQPATGASGQREAEAKMSEVAAKVQRGQPLDAVALRAGLDSTTRFYVLGLAPNAARLAVRLFLTEPFGNIVERLLLHYADMKIQKEFPSQPDYLSPFRILAECVSPKVTRRDDELKSSWGLLGGALMRSILTGTPYPEGLYAAIINRIRHDSDEERDDGKRRNVKINYARAAFVKAHLLRKYRHRARNPFQEALTMSLNEAYTYPAYVLGRLFAVLEKVQKEAIGNVNASIQDRYFTSACATPASVFPTLLRLSHHHIAKADYGYASDRCIQELLQLLEAKPFPTRLTLDEQGVFVLGYYHQRAAFYTKNSEKDAESEPNN
jgi:CRISPR-associated protein Csd1